MNRKAKRGSRAPRAALERGLHPQAKLLSDDAGLLVIEKPAGVLSHPNPPRRSDPKALFRAPYDFEEECFLLSGAAGERIFLLHRLDLETSGLILAARDEEIAKAVREALRQKRVRKEYTALLLGVPQRAQGCWRDHLERRRTRAGLTVVRSGRGDPNAVTRYRLERILEPAGAALAVLEPETGRSHQLRVQAAGRGVPIAQDARYGDFAANRFLAREIGLKRMFLHAARLELRHPLTGDRVAYESPLPQELAACLERIERLTTPIPRRRKS